MGARLVTAGDLTPGRRVNTIHDVEQPGDYTGPITGYTGPGMFSCFFLKPNARDKDVPARARSVQHVNFPPHSYTLHQDGKITISPSIGDQTRDGGPESSDGWHGFLEHGVWRQV